MANFDLTNLAVKMLCPNNHVQVDDYGYPSVLVYIPAFKLSDVLVTEDNSVHPAFLVNGQQIPGFYYSKYQNVVNNGKAYSLPGEDPAVSTSFDAAVSACSSKGYGWHLSTNAEWAAIALWCKKNGFQPYGHNAIGKDSRETVLKAIPTLYDDLGNTKRVATGTGPLTWSHDNTMSGIWDMNGNVWEWQGGVRIMWGELQIIANNDAADPNNPQNATSTCWKAIRASDGALVEPENNTTTKLKSGATIRLDYVDSKWKFTTNITSSVDDARTCLFKNVTYTEEVCEAAITLLRALALLPDLNEEGYDGDAVWWNNYGLDRCLFRGGCSQAYNTQAGVFSMIAHNSRESNTTTCGFRCAYIPEIPEA